MKHKFIIIFSILSLISGLQSFAEDNSANDIYVYRNDGNFNAFFSDEVDSLVYSNKDLNGIEHTKAVVQEIWTADSVYRIPLSAIDSISVTRPETRYKSSVKKLSPDYLPYIESVDSLTISFSKNLPYKLRINKGDILIYEGFEAPFEQGFAGRIKSIQTGTSIVASCETVELTDIYDQYVALGECNVVASQSDRRKAPGDYTSSFSFPIDITAGPLSVNGEAILSVTLRSIAIIHEGNTHIELYVKNNNSLDVNLSLGGNVENEKKFESGKLAVNLPNIPLLRVFLSYGLFLSSDINGSFGAFSYNGNSEYNFTVIYDNGKIRHSFKPGKAGQSISGLDEFNVKGSLWTGVVLWPGVETIGSIVRFDIENKFGTCLEFDVSAPISIDWKKDAYSALKNSTINASIKIGSDLELKSVLNKTQKTPKITICPSFKIFEHIRHLVPEFSDLKIEHDSKSITTATTATGEIAFPCQVGFSIYDEEDNLVTKEYDSQRYTWDSEKLDYSHKFDTLLHPGTKYKVTPIVKLGPWEMDAAPSEELYLDCNVHTGSAVANTYSVEANGYSDEILSENIKTGFVYTSKRIEPTVENAMSVEAETTDNYQIKGGFSGLDEGTTYYYRVYVLYDDKYYYGETQCITTKKDIDEFETDNYGGDYKKGRKLFAYTGRAYNIEQRKARIELTFDAVTPSTRCGYYLEADGKRGKELISKCYPLGTVTGNHTVELENLIPGTTYTYWAIAENNLGKSSATSRTFKTEPSPDPVFAILEVNDIKMKSAIVSCYFENVEDALESGIEVTTDGWSYNYTARPGNDGKAEVKLPNLLAETEYNVRCYVKTEEGTQFEEKTTNFSTLAPDVTGWYTFSDPQHDGRIFDLELRSNGTTNTFWGVNRMSWKREGRKLTMQWRSIDPNSTAFWEYRGEFNEEFNYASGNVYYVIDSPSHELHDEMLWIENKFYIRKK